MQLRRPCFVLGVGIDGFFGRRVWSTWLLRAMSLFSNPCVSKVSIKTCVIVSSDSAIILDNMLTLAGRRSKWEKKCEVRQFLPFFKVRGISVYKPHKPQAYPAAPLKKLSIKLATLNSPSTVLKKQLIPWSVVACHNTSRGLEQGICGTSPVAFSRCKIT